MTDVTEATELVTEEEQSRGKKKNPTVKQNEVKNIITSMWFGGLIEDHKTCTKRFDLEPHAALCLLIMATENATSSLRIQMSLHGFGGGLFQRTEAAIVAEYGLYSLKDAGFIKLDAKGEKELSEHGHKHYGLGDVQWRLTAKGARRIVPTYCSCKGLESSYQDQAVNDILAANKAAIAEFRKQNK